MTSKKRKASRLARRVSLLVWSAPPRVNGWSRPMIYRFADCELDEQLYQLRRNGVSVALEPKVFDVLAYLLQHRDRIVSNDELLDKLWPGQVVGENALTRCIRAARAAVGDDGTKQAIIETQRGRGYRFIAQLTPPQPVSGSTFQVPGQEEENPNSHLSAVEETNGKSSLESSVQSLESEEQVFSAPSQTSDARRQTLDGLTPVRSWSRKSLLLTTVMLLIGTALTVYYLSRPLPNPQSPTPNPQSLPLPDKPSIAVLPFTNMSQDPTQEYFSDGLTDTLITDLSRISSLFVIARHSSFTYKGKPTKVQEISKELGVRYLLEGSVQKGEDRLRINAQLVDATTGHHVWSDRYDRLLTDIFTVQDEIVQQLVTTLQVEVKEAELARVRRIPTSNLTAYDAVLRAEELFQQISKDGVAQARPLSEHAIALDPQYAAAHAFLGWTYWEESHWDPDPQKLERAFALAQQAIALDDSLPAAHSLLSLIHQRTQRPEQAIAEGRWAVALDANNAYSYFWLAEVLNYEGKPAEAIELLQKAMRLDPHYPYWFPYHLGLAYLLSGRYAEAITAYQQSIPRQPNAFTYADLAQTYLLQWIVQLDETPQILAQASEAAQQAIALSDSLWSAHLALGYVYAFQRQYEQAIAEMERAVALDPFGALTTTSLATVLSWAGRAEEALRAAEQVQYRRFTVRDFHLSQLGAAYALIGHYEEAQTTLQRFLARYPNHLSAHLDLAAVYSQLGKEPEARAEAAEVLRINPKFSLKVHQERFAIKDPAMLERHLAALRKAGLR